VITIIAATTNRVIIERILRKGDGVGTDGSRLAEFVATDFAHFTTGWV
jgi:hypothetical protein